LFAERLVTARDTLAPPFGQFTSARSAATAEYEQRREPPQPGAPRACFGAKRAAAVGPNVVLGACGAEARAARRAGARLSRAAVAGGAAAQFVLARRAWHEAEPVVSGLSNQPASNSSAQANRPAALQLKQRSLAHESRSQARVAVGVRAWC